MPLSPKPLRRTHMDQLIARYIFVEELVGDVMAEAVYWVFPEDTLSATRREEERSFQRLRMISEGTRSHSLMVDA
jgi:hypothetical protein